MKHLHPDDEILWPFIEDAAYHYADVFGLRLRKIQPLPRAEWKEVYGCCCEDGVIQIGFRRKGQPDEAYQIVDTLAHELAHLAHMNHERHWAALFGRIFCRMAEDRVLDKLLELCDSRGVND